MGPNVADSATGVFFGAFAMFAATTASIMSGSLIERVKIVGFTILAIVLGSFVWILGAAWGWHADGWLVTALGYHDFGASGVVHAIAGFFTLGVLINLGARIGKFNPDGSANAIPGHSMPATLVGLMLIIAGFWGFLMGCVIFPGEAWSWRSGTFATIYGTPVTLSAMTFNILMGFAGGAIAAWVMTRDPFWMMSGALGGIISVAAGLDLYWPPMAFVIAMIGGVIMPIVARYVERMQIDDAVGAVALHGVVGLWGVVAVGHLCQRLSGLATEGAPHDHALRAGRGGAGHGGAWLRAGLSSCHYVAEGPWACCAPRARPSSWVWTRRRCLPSPIPSFLARCSAPTSPCRVKRLKGEASMIGTDITDWAAVEGAYYAGMGSEAIWLFLSMILCVGALVLGALHEKEAYKKTNRPELA